MGKSLVFSAFIELCNYEHNLNLKHVQNKKKEIPFYCHLVTFIFFFFPSPSIWNIYSVLIDLPILNMLFKWYVLFCN